MYISVWQQHIPYGYQVPSFPSLYWPTLYSFEDAKLYHMTDIWRFTLYWSLIFLVVFYGAAGIWAAITHRKLAFSIWIVVVYLTIAAFHAVVAGSVVGVLIGQVYRAGAFSMSTWIPMCWGVILTLYVLISSYTITGVAL
ncbi:BA75_04833T0 [Komagataella pastoris]|uniref:BA75_04833T0 n=1 Tax=Komagataella pastoris TaxID=4922 RepID=A0A1B2JGZ1_PICPA|nr:BA75_04833T0 [Komagataella pastoris]